MKSRLHSIKCEPIVPVSHVYSVARLRENIAGGKTLKENSAIFKQTLVS